MTPFERTIDKLAEIVYDEYDFHNDTISKKISEFLNCPCETVYDSKEMFCDQDDVTVFMCDYSEETSVFVYVGIDEDNIITSVTVRDAKKVKRETAGEGFRKEFFPVTSISRDDLASLGYKTEDITDEQMEQLARKMANDYLEQLYWTSMDIIAEDLGFEKDEQDS